MIDYGILIRKDGKFKALTGNQIGVIMLEYILSQMKEKNILKNNYYVSTSIVSTNLTKRIAKEYGVKSTGVPLSKEAINASLDKGNPIIGDKLYSNDGHKYEKMYLGALKVIFNHPVTNKKIEVNSSIKNFYE